MKSTILEPGKFYHIYNRAQNGDPLFEDEEAFRFFLKLYKSYVVPVAETYAYCLLEDHLHLLVKIREEVAGSSYSSFAKLFNSYAKGYNKKNGKAGRVFRFKLKKVEIHREIVLRDIIRYINQNAEKHGLVNDCSHYRYSSYQATVTTCPTLIPKEEIQNQFGNMQMLAHYFSKPVDEKGLKMYLLE